MPAPELETLLATYGRHHPNGKPERLDRAYELAKSLHEGQTRQTGDPYISHPLAVAELLADLGMGSQTLAAALLHDVVEDTPATLEEIREQFGDVVADLIDGVTKMDRVKFSSREEQQAATIRKLAIAMAADIRVLLIKLVDRLHNMRTIAPLPEEKQKRVARETLDVYAPLAHRLGVQEIKHELEDRCFAVLYPRRASEIDALMNRRAPERNEYISKVQEAIIAALDEAGIVSEVSGRPKHSYSIYRKMIDSGLEFDEIYDLIGIRIIVEELRDCYGALGLIHTIWPPIHGRFKDYIAMPKLNRYQSLHTTVVGPDGKPLEVQIRTRDMHERAEFGIAAHWRYKEGAETPEEMPFVADIRYLQDEHDDPAEFLANLKLDLYQDEVFTLTPNGRVITLPKGATPVDFAYRIHTDVGHRTSGAKVNGRLVPLSTELVSGDIVEILTTKGDSARPSRDWLEFVKSTRAASKIRQWYSRERREVALAEGKDLIMKAIAKEGLGLGAHDRDAFLDAVAEELGYMDLDAMFVAVGEHNMNPATAVSRLVRLARPEEDASDDDLLAPPPTTARRPSGGIIVEGWEDMLVRIARCCAPVPGDDIVGFVTVGRGVSVHRADCANIGALGEKMERIIDVSWAPQQSGTFFVWIQVESLDRPKLLRDVTAVISDLGANIHASSSGTGRDRVAILRYEVELASPEQLETLVGALRGVDGVFDAYRLVPQT